MPSSSSTGPQGWGWNKTVVVQNQFHRLRYPRRVRQMADDGRLRLGLTLAMGLGTFAGLGLLLHEVRQLRQLRRLSVTEDTGAGGRGGGGGADSRRAPASSGGGLHIRVSQDGEDARGDRDGGGNGSDGGQDGVVGEAGSGPTTPRPGARRRSSLGRPPLHRRGLSSPTSPGSPLAQGAHVSGPSLEGGTHSAIRELVRFLCRLHPTTHVRHPSSRNRACTTPYTYTSSLYSYASHTTTHRAMSTMLRPTASGQYRGLS